MLLWRQYKMENNGNYDALIQELSEVQSKLESCGKEYLKLVSEQAHHISTLSTQQTEGYRILKEHLDSQLEALISAMKYISQHLKNAQQFAVSPQSISKSGMNGNLQEWYKTWYDSWITSLNSLSDMLRKS
jgi:uncharacterized protein YukE